MIINCIFSEPVEIATDNWEYSAINCTGTDSTSTTALILNADTGAEFYLDKKINYGDVLILVFLLSFFIFCIFKVVSDFFIPRRVTKF